MITERLPKVAVLLAAYNGINWIEDQVLSVLEQELVDVTLFISVDFSDDGTDIWAEEFALKHSNVYTLSYGKKYGSAAANFFRLIKCVDYEDFDFVALCDQDDIWFKDKLIVAADSIYKNDASGYSSDVVAFWDDGREVLIKKSYEQSEYDHFFESPGPGCTFVMRSDVLCVLKGDIVDGRLSVDKLKVNHDWFIYAFFRSRDYTWLIDSKPNIKYRQHSGNEVGANKGLRAAAKRLSMIKSKWYRDQVNLIVGLLAPLMAERLNSRIFLAANFYKLRRRPRDKVVILFLILFGLY